MGNLTENGDNKATKTGENDKTNEKALDHVGTKEKLERETESLLIAAENNVMKANYITAKIENTQ